MISALQTAVLQVTTACPLSCAQCYMKHTGIHMSLPTARDILLRAKELGAEVVQLTTYRIRFWLPNVTAYVASAVIHYINP